MDERNGSGLPVIGQTAIAMLLDTYATALALWDDYPPPPGGELAYLVCRSQRAAEVVESARRLLAARPVNDETCAAEARQVRTACAGIAPRYRRGAIPRHTHRRVL
jgi:hypothetical protein